MVSSNLQTLSPWQNFRQRLQNSPPLKTEESILLRILVQTLVIIGIIATDVAAQTQMSLWAIPLSIAGGIWSWYHRQKRNITMKFILAIGMLATLVYFLANLNLNDTRLSLAELLIQLQVLHSFDLPRRKDLGYSMVIGLILLGIAGTLSQTFIFAPGLLGFLMIAIPTLILDYRSRLGLEKIDNYLTPKSSVSSTSRINPFNKYSPLSWQRLSIFIGLSLLLGLVIFALIPRFPGYQFKTFPMSGTAELANQVFDQENQDVVNPGYIREGNPDSQGEARIGINPSEGGGTVDNTFYYGFNTTMNQNLRGSMKPELVMRVRSQAPGFWRVLAFDHYTGKGWEISRNENLFKLNRSIWQYRYYVGLPPIYTRTKEIIQSYSLVSTLPNVIPSLSYPQYVYFPAKEIAIDPEGSLRSPGLLTEGLTYTIISQVPYRDRTLLGTAKENYPPEMSKYYLQIPPEIADKVRAEAERLLAQSPNPLTSVYEKVLYLTQAIKQNYQIIEDLPFFKEEEDLVEAFLFRYQGGYGDHFSTVLTVMLRSLGIPARLAVGFAPGQFNPFTGYYLVHNTDAHAVTEVYLSGFGWFSFDPIPGHELIPPSFEQEQPWSVLKQLWQWVAGWLPSPITGIAMNLWNFLVGGLLTVMSWVWKFVSGSLIGVLVGLITAIAFGFGGWLGWNYLRNWQSERRLGKLPPLEQIYQQMLALLKSKGYPKHPAQTPLEYAQNANQHHPPQMATLIEDISQAYVSWRYGQQPPNLDHQKQQFKTFKKMIDQN
ncbi:transglutaminase domain protein [Gloeothece citriformis PCC 7424]|uniref:Transglutaminase domain protein n=1 Tax=Gloeothece citriformis (strain PCC 7424) TaxID=65393 RepID=B7K9V3_GLOC7|nr:DUF3488 and DUF4129 domain-containing transglutaminase family protein [Gloeothece citriformis]ACK71309.1 transglutaminase domain protein [Gloeothece citriformis PCC 7424]